MLLVMGGGIDDGEAAGLQDGGGQIRVNRHRAERSLPEAFVHQAKIDRMGLWLGAMMTTRSGISTEEKTAPATGPE